MSYDELHIDDLEEARSRLQDMIKEQEELISGIRGKIKVYRAEGDKTRRVLAVDSGFNRAYETTFTLVRAAVLNEEMDVYSIEGIYLFHSDNHQADRLRRLLMQQSLYKALYDTVQRGVADGSIVLVDGTLTLNVLYPTLRDRREYQRHFRDFYKDLYTPLMDGCLERDIIIIGFLKRAGSNYLAEYLNIPGAYDSYIMNFLLREDGEYISAIPVIDANAQSMGVKHRYVNFYLDLKNWNYRFELLKEQEETCRECVVNLLYMATETHQGMSPVFSKADEYARVSKREVNLKYDYIVHNLSYEERELLRLRARKKTHFGYHPRRLSQRLIEE